MKNSVGLGLQFNFLSSAKNVGTYLVVYKSKDFGPRFGGYFGEIIKIEMTMTGLWETNRLHSIFTLNHSVIPKLF